MNLLLVILCPLNPRIRSLAARDDIDIAGPAESFRWCLIEYQTQESAPRITQEGTGTLNNTPFADEALVIMPTADVRLIHTKVPLIGGKKLDALLPTLAEPYLLDQRTPLRYQLLPPSPGAQGIERTIAIISEPWMIWLHDQLANLPVRRLTLVPDCLLLTEPDDSGAITEFLIDQQSSQLVAIANREGNDWGSGWIEAVNDKASLAELYPHAQLATLNNAWLMGRALNWLTSKSPINLISRQPAKKASKASKSRSATRWQPKVEWALWRKQLHLAIGFVAVYLIGSMLYLSLLAISNWRWQSTLAETARQYLATPVPDNAGAVSAFVRQATSKIHAQGKGTPGDFVPMAGKLQILLNNYPAGLLESVQYQPNGLAFTLRNSKETPGLEVLSKRALTLEIALVQIGKNEYHMLPLAGLTGKSTQ